MDPMEFRLKNAVQAGDPMPNGAPHAPFGCRELEEAMLAHPHYDAPLTGPNQGRGVAVGFRWQGGQSSSATIHVNSNGTINLITGYVDIGGTRTAVAMQVAEVLGLQPEAIAPTVVDTDTIGYTATTGGSRIAFDTGLAAIAAAQEVKQQMAARAALLWKRPVEDVVFTDGVFTCTAHPAERLSFQELAGQLMRTGGAVTCSASANSTGVGPIFAGNIVDVEVDPETGKVQILRYTTFLDAGCAVHPSYVEGQMQGGTVQGIGWALNEEYFFTADGTLANSSFLDYRMPTPVDVPMIETVILEVPNPRHPFGHRGVGEAPIIPPLAALANAIYQAVGVRMDQLPMSPGAILRKLKQEPGYFNDRKRTLPGLLRDLSAAKTTEERQAIITSRLAWGEMRMDPTDLADVTGYTFLVNGRGPTDNWTGLFRSGEKVRLRFINGSSMTHFDVRIPGLKMTVVAADGQYVHPVTVDEFRIATAETDQRK